MITFSEKDKNQLQSKGISEEKVLQQITTFKEGIPFINLEKAAVVSDGIRKLREVDEINAILTFDAQKDRFDLLKFVPASGAASRMFKAFFNFLEAYQPQEEALEDYFERSKDTAIKTFFDGLQQLPFYNKIYASIEGEGQSEGAILYLFIDEMLREKGFNFGFYPKGLLPFHKYNDHAATPFEEHLKEAALYASSKGEAKLHFTISEQHGDLFNQEFNAIKSRISQATKTSFEVSYSFQKAATDTIAVNMDNTLFKNSDGSLLFRPGGHGALIENLNEQDADIIFIKNIDNVVTEKMLPKIAESKKILAGLLIEIQEKAFEYAALLETADASLETDKIKEIQSFLESELNVRFGEGFQTLDTSKQLAILKDKINRPIRVCGMVKNEGEPGGGPFWVQNAHGEISLQIIESAQVNTSDEQQLAIFKNSTHFNPVDLVCGVKDHHGNSYNLLDFVDKKQGFITEKTKDGAELKALELPGLWNGAMAYWNTIFVEVPLVTFNPVKTVNDLLKPMHQV